MWQKLLVSLILTFSCFRIFATAPFPTKPSVMLCKHDAGLFSCYILALGMAHEYDCENFSAIEVNFDTTGLYYDPQKGPNWWTYYFEPVKYPTPKNIVPSPLIDAESIAVKLWKTAITMDRNRANELINKYMKTKQIYIDECDAFINQKTQGCPFIGIHYRGTDKQGTEATVITPELAVSKIKEVANCPKYIDYLIFVATDEERFLNLMKNEFKGRVFFLPMQRSKNAQPLHFCKGIPGYQKGQEALQDCLILSHSSILIRTISNLSEISMFLNPNVPVIYLNDRSDAAKTFFSP